MNDEGIVQIVCHHSNGQSVAAARVVAEVCVDVPMGVPRELPEELAHLGTPQVLLVLGSGGRVMHRRSKEDAVGSLPLPPDLQLQVDASLARMVAAVGAGGVDRGPTATATQRRAAVTSRTSGRVMAEVWFQFRCRDCRHTVQKREEVLRPVIQVAAELGIPATLKTLDDIPGSRR